MKWIIFILFLLPIVVSAQPVDSNATTETVALYNYLKSLQGNHILFGHQDELLVGALHPRRTGGSDTYDMIQDYPALYGFDFAWYEMGKDKNFSNLWFVDIIDTIKAINARGGIVTLTWPINNPLDTTQTKKDLTMTHPIRRMLSSPDSMITYDRWLDTLASFFNNLKDANGKNIPIIFRPFHECTASWFWWGTQRSSDFEYIQFYQYTENYLRNKGVHNLLYAYCTGNFPNRDEFLSRYPGDNYIDIVGFDAYDDLSNYPGFTSKDRFIMRCNIVSAVAAQKDKISALLECGFTNMPIYNYWTNMIWDGIKNSNFSYIMNWGNYGTVPGAFWGTYHGQLAEPDFIKFSQQPKLYFLSDVQ